MFTLFRPLAFGSLSFCEGFGELMSERMDDCRICEDEADEKAGTEDSDAVFIPEWQGVR